MSKVTLSSGTAIQGGESKVMFQPLNNHRVSNFCVAAIADFGMRKVKGRNGPDADLGECQLSGRRLDDSNSGEPQFIELGLPVAKLRLLLET